MLLDEKLKLDIFNAVNERLLKYKIKFTERDKNTVSLNFYDSDTFFVCMFISNSSKAKYENDFKNITKLVCKNSMEYLERRYVLKQSNNFIQNEIGLNELTNLKSSFYLLEESLGKDKLKKLISKIQKDNKFSLVKMKGIIIDSVRSNYGTAYKWKMKIEYNNKQYTFNYTNSVNNGTNEPSLKDCLYSLISDRGCYLAYSGDIDGFAGEFCEGLSYSETKRIYNGCERTSEALERVFGDDLCWFEKELQDY